jgi:uncharacterized membrane protein YhdT
VPAFKTHKKTAWVIWVAISILLGWEIKVYISPEMGDTISEVYLSAAFAHPMVPFLTGLLMGHLNLAQSPVQTTVCSKCMLEVKET